MRREYGDVHAMAGVQRISGSLALSVVLEDNVRMCYRKGIRDD
jgi:hypothetical protein